ncbi:MAG: hypothetical protein FWF45_04510 [Coriobacteriia bacterium]|nr:hypothetical protein [Coriobacteriia bacterium]
MLKRKSFIALLLVFVLALAGAPAAFATQSPNDDGAIVSDNETSVVAVITKVLQTPKDTAVPNPMDFTFKATPKTVDGVAYNNTNMPPLNPNAMKVEYPGGTKGTLGANTDTYSQQTADIFANVSFDHAGTYVYTIEENPNTYPGNPAINETLTYSGAVYTLTVYVANTSTGSTYVKSLGTTITTTDTPTQQVDTKVDPTPGDETTSSDFSEMTFTNTYVKTNSSPDNPDPTNPDDNTLAVSKTVAGDAGDRTLPFTFAMTVNAPALVYAGTGTAPIYHAYVMAGSTVVSGPIAFTSGTEESFQLIHGQKLVFVDTPVGTTYEVNESGSANYIASANVVTDGSTPVEVSASGTAGAALATGMQIVGESVNSADYTNTYNFITATGLLIHNLPFIGMIVLAAAALGTYITISIRKRKNAATQA